jgi:hypothetical protein
LEKKRKMEDGEFPETSSGSLEKRKKKEKRQTEAML